MASLPPKVSWCDLARNYNGLSAIAGIHVRVSKELHWFERQLQWLECHRRYPCSFEPGITLVSPPSKVSWCDLVRNYNGLSAIAGVHVRLSKELQWFEQTPRCPGAI